MTNLAGLSKDFYMISNTSSWWNLDEQISIWKPGVHFNIHLWSIHKREKLDKAQYSLQKHHAYLNDARPTKATLRGNEDIQRQQSSFLKAAVSFRMHVQQSYYKLRIQLRLSNACSIFDGAIVCRSHIVLVPYWEPQQAFLFSLSLKPGWINYSGTCNVAYMVFFFQFVFEKASKFEACVF